MPLLYTKLFFAPVSVAILARMGERMRKKVRVSFSEAAQRFILDKNAPTPPDPLSIEMPDVEKVARVGLAGAALTMTPFHHEATAGAVRPLHSVEQALATYEKTGATLNTHDIEELALNVLHEAAGEPYEGQLAVAQVTIARALSGRKEFGDGTISGTVRKKNQFSWTREPLKEVGLQKDTHTLSRLEKTLQLLLRGTTKEMALSKLSALTDIPRQCYFYKRTDWDESKMSKKTAAFFATLTPIKTIGNHTFYVE